MSENRLVAGIGFRRETPSQAIVALIRRALGEAGLGDRLIAIATAADRARDPAIREAARAFGLVPVAVEAEVLERVDYRVPTRSARIERLRGVGSLAEAAAVAVAGDGGRLVLARIDDGLATCAVAVIKNDAIGRKTFPPPSPGEGDPGSVSDEVSALSEGIAPPSRPALTRGPPSPAEGGGKARVIGAPRVSSVHDRQHTSCRFGRRPTPQIATPTP